MILVHRLFIFRFGVNTLRQRCRNSKSAEKKSSARAPASEDDTVRLLRDLTHDAW